MMKTECISTPHAAVINTRWGCQMCLPFMHILSFCQPALFLHLITAPWLIMALRNSGGGERGNREVFDCWKLIRHELYICILFIIRFRGKFKPFFIVVLWNELRFMLSLLFFLQWQDFRTACSDQISWAFVPKNRTSAADLLYITLSMSLWVQETHRQKPY